ncbi:hypothetical protein PTT_12677 [Pyrenophora teres f. teres 0-1]|uniref:Uncharacterized protein n=1 Tax=Pyrenophora teres f. teres (strain 0-1) TaxID=861557 RepID=E3RUC6_PYRTT|nr:hypothetical protein PTT_12677 [Pyrenophora teres f. teres 0-1]
MAAAAVILTIRTKKTTRTTSAPREPSPTAGSLVTLSGQRSARLTLPRLSANAQLQAQQRLPQAEAAQPKPIYDRELQDVHGEPVAGASLTQGATVFSGTTKTTWGWNRNPMGGTYMPTGNGGNVLRT